MNSKWNKMLQWLAKPKQNNIWNQLLRYLLSGGLAFIVDKLLFLLTRYYFDLNKYISTTIGFGVGLIITYTLSVVWIFPQHRLKSHLAEIGVFALIGLVGMLLMNVFMWAFTSIGITNDFIANLASTVCVTLWNFIAKKYILFTAPKEEKDTKENV